MKGANVMNEKTTNVLYYCTFIGWIIAALAGDANASLNHKNQGFVLGVAGLLLGVIGNIFWFVPVIGIIFGIILNVVHVVIVILMIVGIVNAVNEEDKLIPFICSFRVFND